MKYAVMFEIEKGEPEYVRTENPFNIHTPVLLFDSKEAAQAEAQRWNTGQVVVWTEYCPSCREPFDSPAGDGCALLARHKGE